MWRIFPLIALARASCYDYEYYDPDTGSSIPGNACAKQAAAGGVAVGQPATGAPALASYSAPATAFASTSFPATTFSGAAVSSISSPVYGSVSAAPAFSTYTSAAPAFSTYTSAAPAFSTYTSAAPAFSTYTSAAPAFSTYPTVGSAGFSSTPYTTVTTAPALSTTTYGSISGPVYASAPIATTTVVRPPVAATTVYGAVTAAPRVAATVVAPAAVTVRAPAAVTARAPANGGSSQLSSELQYYKELGERQARQHKQNARAVDEASKDLSRTSLLNRVFAGSSDAIGTVFPIVRLGYQKEVADAYLSEKRIANKNAEDAYQRYQKDPSRLNLLVSKYQDLNADLRDAAYHYNVVNSATFGQNIATTSGLFGGLLGGSGSGIFGGLTQIITQKQQSSDLNDIQQQMQRVQRQIQVEVQAVAAQKAGASNTQGSVQQRMMAMSVYGPQRG